jgi:hypothetical protein
MIQSFGIAFNEIPKSDADTVRSIKADVITLLFRKACGSNPKQPKLLCKGSSRGVNGCNIFHIQSSSTLIKIINENYKKECVPLISSTQIFQ